jgi:hypothetical protein
LVIAGGTYGGEKSGGFLSLASTEKGESIVELPMDTPPVHHGLAVAGERVYVSLQTGAVVCLGKGE